ncbi:MAG: trimethylamine methyltransferase family protein [Saccharofermentanales bacterium]
MNYPNIDGFDAARAYEGAKKLLAEVGILVLNKKILVLAAKRLSIRDGRVYFAPDVVDDYVENKIRYKGEPEKVDDTAGSLDLYNSGVNCRYIDAETGEAHPFDTPSLIEHTKFIRQLGVEGRFHGGTPGYALDVHPEIQFLNTYYVDILYNPDPGSFSLCASARSMRYQIEMAEIMGQKQSFCVEPLSPMRLIGDSVDITVALCEPGMVAIVDPLPAIGVTAPMDWHAAWAQTMAENISACILLDMLGIRCFPTFRLFVPNMSTGMTYFSSPHALKGLLIRRKVKEFFGYTERNGELLLVTAKQPDQQAAAEKMAGCVAGAIHGFRYLEGAGNLDVDNLFCARQLMIDLEIRDFVRAMLSGTSFSAGIDIVQEVRDGIKAGGYLQSDLTLDNWRDFMWQPKLFDVGGTQATSIIGRAAKVSFKETAASYQYELGGNRREQVERLMARARQEFRIS